MAKTTGSPNAGRMARTDKATDVTGRSPDQKRFDIFLIDSGWRTADSVRQVLEANRDVFRAFTAEHQVYEVSQEQSIALMKQYPSLIGMDPIVMVIDKDAFTARKQKGFGFRLNLGLLHRTPERVVSLLQEALQILYHRATAIDIAQTVQTISHREGLRGTVEIIFETVEGVQEKTESRP